MVREQIRLWIVRVAMAVTVIGMVGILFFVPRSSIRPSGMATLLGLEQYDLLIAGGSVLLFAGGVGVITVLSRDD